MSIVNSHSSCGLAPVRLSLVAVVGAYACLGLCEPTAVRVGGFYKLDGAVVRVKCIETKGATIVSPRGSTSTVNPARLVEVPDWPTEVSRCVEQTETHFGEVKHEIDQFRARLSGEFDGAFLEMMTACLTAGERPSHGEQKLDGYLTVAREHGLKELVSDCKKFDVSALIDVLTECEFCGALAKYGMRQVSAALRAAEREMKWLEANAPAQPEDKTRSTQEQIAAKKQVMQELPGQIKAMMGDNEKLTQMAKAVGPLEKGYHATYEKAADVLGQYVRLREAVAENGNVAEEQDAVQKLASDWGKGLLLASTLDCVASARSARAELDRRRAAGTPDSVSASAESTDSSATDSTSAGGSAEAPRKGKPNQGSKKGCFIATAVYKSYDHPDVIVLRGFRDGILGRSVWGRRFVAWYYDKGPGYAKWLSGRPATASLVRFLLRVLVLLLTYPLLFCLVALGSIVGVWRLLRHVWLRRHVRTSHAEAV